MQIRKKIIKMRSVINSRENKDTEESTIKQKFVPLKRKMK